MYRNYRNYILLFILVLATGCFSDDGTDRSSVQYRVVLDKPIETTISYRSGALTMIQTEIPLGTTQWYTIEYVEEGFEALLIGSFLNPSAETVNYTIWLFDEGKPVIKRQGTVEANSEQIEEVRYVTGT